MNFLVSFRMVLVTGFCVVLLQSIQVRAGENDSWKISADNTARITGAVHSEPPTSLRIEQEFNAVVDARSNPASGRIKFRSGFSRDFIPLELTMYWNMLKAPSAVWDYYKAQGKVSSYVTPTPSILQELFGKTTRVLTKNNIELIGKILSDGNGIDQFIVDIDGHIVHCTLAAVRELQQLQ